MKTKVFFLGSLLAYGWMLLICQPILAQEEAPVSPATQNAPIKKNILRRNTSTVEAESSKNSK